MKAELNPVIISGITEEAKLLLVAQLRYYQLQLQKNSDIVQFNIIKRWTIPHPYFEEPFRKQGFPHSLIISATTLTVTEYSLK